MDRKPRTDGGPYIGRSDAPLRGSAPRARRRAAIPTTFRCRAGLSRCSCARRTPMPRSTASTPPRRATMPGVIAVLTGADYVADGLKGALQRRQSGRRDRHQGARVRAGKAPGAGRAAISAGGRPRALSGRSRRDRGGGNAARRARRRRGGRRSITRCCRPSPTCRRADGAEPIWPSAPDNVALDQEFGDAAAVRGGVRRGRSRGRADFRNQRIVNCQMEPRSGVASYDAATAILHAHLRQPGRPRAAHGAGGKLRRCRRKKSASSAPTSAAASGCATISIPSRPRSCGRPSASAGR